MSKLLQILFFLSSFTLISIGNCLASNADNLFDWAEGEYPQLFAPSPSATLTDSDWEYRVYNDTQTAIGVKNGKKVYVTGEPFGVFLKDIVFVGDLVDLLESGTVQFTIEGGVHTGRYGGKLNTKDSGVRITKVGGDKYIHIRLIHQRDNKGDEVLFGITLKLGGIQNLIGTHDLTNTLSQVGLLPNGVSHDDKYFTVSPTSGGSGTLNLEKIDENTGAAKGSFVINQDGVVAKGTFLYIPERK